MKSKTTKQPKKETYKIRVMTSHKSNQSHDKSHASATATVGVWDSLTVTGDTVIVTGVMCHITNVAGTVDNFIMTGVT